MISLDAPMKKAVLKRVVCEYLCNDGSAGAVAAGGPQLRVSMVQGDGTVVLAPTALPSTGFNGRTSSDLQPRQRFSIDCRSEATEVQLRFDAIPGATALGSATNMFRMEIYDTMVEFDQSNEQANA